MGRRYFGSWKRVEEVLQSGIRGSGRPFYCLLIVIYVVHRVKTEVETR